MKKIFCLCLLFAFGVSCFSKNNSGDLFKYISKHYIDVDNKTNRFDIIDRIGDISVLNLKAGDDWMYMDSPMMAVSDNGYYFLSDRTYYFLGYDKSGNLKFSKPLTGRGRGEVQNVGNMFMMNDTLMVYDLVLGRLLCYSDMGDFIGYDNKTEIDVSILYKNSDSYLGLTIYGENEKNNHYCITYNKDASRYDSYLSMPPYLVGLNETEGYTKLSYIFHDTLRFMLNYDYNIFSLTKNGVESTYRFKADKEMTKDIFDGITGAELMLPGKEAMVYNGGALRDISGLFETDKYIVANIFINNKYHSMLYDKTQNSCGIILRPDSFFEESLVPKLTTLDIWKYIWFSFTRLCEYENTIYGCVSYSLYYILSKTESIHDAKIRSLYKQLKSYVEEQNLSEGDPIFLTMELL